jgi:hypothetical protein
MQMMGSHLRVDQQPVQQRHRDWDLQEVHNLHLDIRSWIEAGRCEAAVIVIETAIQVPSTGLTG